MALNKVLVAFDGSYGSKKALKTALDSHGCDNMMVITIVNDDKQAIFSAESPPPLNHLNPVVNNGLYQYAIEEEMNGKNQQSELARHSHDEAINKGNDILLEAKEIISNRNMNALTETIISDDPAKSLCDYADTHQFDLIVVGNRGLSGLKKLLLGSVSQKVVQEAPCPVLVVK